MPRQIFNNKAKFQFTVDGTYGLDGDLVVNTKLELSVFGTYKLLTLRSAEDTGSKCVVFLSKINNPFAILPYYLIRAY